MKPAPTHGQEGRFAALNVEALRGPGRARARSMNEAANHFRVFVNEPQVAQMIERLNGHREDHLEVAQGDSLRNLLDPTPCQVVRDEHRARSWRVFQELVAQVGDV